MKVTILIRKAINKYISLYICKIILKMRFRERISLGKNIHLKSRCVHRITKGSSFVIGNGVCFPKSCQISVPNGVMQIGDGTYFNSNLYLVCREKIVIGVNCMFGPNTTIVDHDHTFSDEGIQRDTFRTMPIQIGDNVWCGANVVILKGASIGEGSVIGAGCVVTGIIPPHSLVSACRELNIRKIENRHNRKY